MFDKDEFFESLKSKAKEFYGSALNHLVQDYENTKDFLTQLLENYPDIASPLFNGVGAENGKVCRSKVIKESFPEYSGSLDSLSKDELSRINNNLLNKFSNFLSDEGVEVSGLFNDRDGELSLKINDCIFNDIDMPNFKPCNYSESFIRSYFDALAIKKLCSIGFGAPDCKFSIKLNYY